MRRLLAPIRATTGTARWLLVAGLLIVGMFVVFALFADWIAPFGYNQTAGADGVKFEKLAPPGGAHLFGVNDLFYDVFSRVVWGARTALLVVLLSVAIVGAASPSALASSSYPRNGRKSKRAAGDITARLAFGDALVVSSPRSRCVSLSHQNFVPWRMTS